MIITWLCGGLGNQMFQYAAGLALAERRRTILKLDVSWFRAHAEYEAHNRYALSCFNVTEQFATQEEIDRVRGVRLTRTERWSVSVARLLRLYRHANRHAAPANLFRPAGAGYDLRFPDQPDNTMLEGMWQSEHYFSPIANLLRLHFTFRYPPQPAVSALAAQIAAGPSAAIHFRRGDYARNPKFRAELGVLDLNYYHRAVAQLLAQRPDVTLYVFSDDIDAIESEFRPPCRHVFVRATDHWHSFDNIRLMSQCDHAIISNSTFAWWGAWLISSPQKIVIAPRMWRRDNPDEWRDAIPPSWTAL